jgi:hypothetical protein
MNEIASLQLEDDDSLALSESLLRRQTSMTSSREMGSFQSIPGLLQHSASGSQRALYPEGEAGNSGQFFSQPLINHTPVQGNPSPSNNNGPS